MTHFSEMNMEGDDDYKYDYEQQEYDSDYDSEYDSDECSKQKRKVLGPIQLAPKKCKCIRCNWYSFSRII